jgi:hypothetical protein
MRNPSKFIHVVEWILVILFAYGVDGLSRRCLAAPAPAIRGLTEQLKAWWANAAAFDKNWLKGSAVVLAASLVGWLVYASSREHLVAYLKEMGDLEDRRPEEAMALAQAISNFSIRQVGWFVLFLTLGLGLLAVVLSGYFKGRRARAGAILLGLVLAVDLGRANLPWVVTWDWERKYTTNPVIDLLRDKPYEHRVAVLPFPVPQRFTFFSDLYNTEWKQQLFQYYNIQSLDYVMNPRPREDEIAFETALRTRNTNTLYRVTRRWQLTNTRYLLGPAVFLDPLNQELDPVQHRFRIAARFEIVLKPDVSTYTGARDELTAVMNPEGHYAVFDFTGALPRALLYVNWQMSPNDQVTLTNLASPEFDPQRTVLVANPSIPSAQAPSGLNPQPSANSVEFASYAPKRILLQAKAGCPAVLLLNDRYNPDWQVWVDGKPETLLRCNYLMRGVYLQPGAHAVEFRFQPPVGTLYVSLAAVFVSLSLLGYLALGRGKDTAPKPAPAARPRPGRQPAQT